MTTTKQLNKTLGNNTKKMKKKKRTTNTTAMFFDTINSTSSHDTLTIIPPVNLTDFENNTDANQPATHNEIIVQENTSSLLGTMAGITATAFLFFSCCLRRHNKQLLEERNKEFKEQIDRVYAAYAPRTDAKL